MFLQEKKRNSMKWNNFTTMCFLKIQSVKSIVLCWETFFDRDTHPCRGLRIRKYLKNNDAVWYA